MIVPVSTQSVDPSLFALPQEIDYNPEDDRLDEELQGPGRSSVTDAEGKEESQRAYGPRTVGQPTAPPEAGRILPPALDKSETEESQTAPGTEVLPAPSPDENADVDALLEGLSLGAALGYLIAKYMAAEREGNRIQAQDYRERIIDALERMSDYMATGAIAGGVGGIVGGVMGLGGAALGGYFLSKVDWNGKPATGMDTMDLPEMGPPGSYGRNVDRGADDGLDTLGDMMRNRNADTPDGPQNSMFRTDAPNGPIRGGMAGDPSVEGPIRGGLASDPSARGGPIRGGMAGDPSARGGPVRGGMAGDPNARIAGMPGAPGAGTGRNRLMAGDSDAPMMRGQSGMQGTNRNRVSPGDSDAPMMRGQSGMPGTGRNAGSGAGDSVFGPHIRPTIAPGRSSQSGAPGDVGGSVFGPHIRPSAAPVRGGLPGAPGSAGASVFGPGIRPTTAPVRGGLPGASGSAGASVFGPGIRPTTAPVRGGLPEAPGVRIGSPMNVQDIDIPSPFGRQTSFGAPNSSAPIRGGLPGAGGMDMDMPSMPRSMTQRGANTSPADGVMVAPHGNRTGRTGAAGNADADRNGPIRGGLRSDPAMDDVDLPTGRPGAPGMGPNTTRGNTDATHGGGRGGHDGDGAGSGQGGRDQHDGAGGNGGNNGGDRHAGDRTTDEMFETGPGTAGGQLGSNGHHDFGMDPVANIQYWTAMAQTATQAGNGMNGLSGSGGSIGSGLANSASKVEEAESERARSLLEGIQSLDENAKETIRSLIDSSKCINDSRRATLQKILG